MIKRSALYLYFFIILFGPMYKFFDVAEISMKGNVMYPGFKICIEVFEVR